MSIVGRVTLQALISAVRRLRCCVKFVWKERGRYYKIPVWRTLRYDKCRQSTWGSTKYGKWEDGENSEALQQLPARSREIRFTCNSKFWLVLSLSTYAGGNMNRGEVMLTITALVIFTCSYYEQHILYCFIVISYYSCLFSSVTINQAANSYLDSRQ